MKKDWFASFLRIWMLGSILWVGLGFYLLPTSFQRPIFGPGPDVFMGTMYDTAAIDYEVLWQFLVVLGVPNFLLLIVLTIAGYQHIRNKPRMPEPNKLG